MTSRSTTCAPPPLHQGQCVQIASDQSGEAQLYQVISIDDRHDRCWLRRWPLARHGSEVFEISLQQVRPSRPHRP
jgi:hypothetical protein